MAFMVMSATKVTDFTTTLNPDGGATIKINSEQRSVFDRNAVGIATIEEAREEATRRNAAEREAGNTNIDWYAIEELPPLGEMLEMLRGEH